MWTLPSDKPLPYTISGIVTDGTTFSGGGLDNDGFSYSSNLLGSTVTFGGTQLTLGPANAADAVANATVVVAGSDDLPQCGAAGNEICGRSPDYYGNVIILRLDDKYQGQSVYVTYGHPRAVYVKPGQHVTTGELLGEVGEEGVAEGPHVHMETRLGANSYTTTRLITRVVELKLRRRPTCTPVALR